MDADWATVALRYALYVDLTLLFGVPLAAMWLLRVDAHLATYGKRATAFMAAAGIVLSVLGLLVAARTMMGEESYLAIDGETVRMIVTETGLGVAWQVRMLALLVCLIASGAPRQWQATRIVLPLAAAIALATLAWGGHGAMSEGVQRAIHLPADIVHLLAAGAWVGALAVFVWLSLPQHATTSVGVAELSRVASGFSRIGAGIVATLVVTGIANYTLIAGPDLSGLLSAPYGGLLLAKLALFGAMLGLAAMNRYRLAPRLARAVHTRDDGAVLALRRSVWCESACAMIVLWLVAWLGTLSPGH
ncbi:copper homeostasis membrane protein CopD [Cupriavidus sp. WKF15]|uniref:copper homeostasis membrane protein CopD n=1 Tax=Cupriavidus sp. WKF15 TaxID=3032282 RepID=UPI0023E2BBD4|nr:copper homeostasis membrane protein CopD [Cupriavidus sp. WKF15]WER44967.1 copper homeostasis membrane protein CopD [Cupriavidus sp. WKF15]